MVPIGWILSGVQVYITLCVWVFAFGLGVAILGSVLRAFVWIVSGK